MGLRAAGLLGCCCCCCCLLPLVLPAAPGVSCKAGCHPVNGFCEFPSECSKAIGAEDIQYYVYSQSNNCTFEKLSLIPPIVGAISRKELVFSLGVTSLRLLKNFVITMEIHSGLLLPTTAYVKFNVHEAAAVSYLHGFLLASSPCQNGGTCIDDNGFASHASCLCPSGFAGNFCEIDRDDCESNPCENGGTCTDIGAGFSCLCPFGYTGKLCSSRVTFCASDPCENGGTCKEHPQGGFKCICKTEFVGATCKHSSKNTSLSGVNTGTKNVQNYKIPPKAHHRSVHQEQEILKITVKETIQNTDPLLSKSQVICFVVLGLLTCLVVLGTTGIVFFSKCEMWLANAKYSHLLRKKKNFLLKSSNGENLSVNIIFPEKIKLTNYAKNYTAI
ncbi:UNVERIFIED_CONTAM: hypothetical protein H355_004536 [Colinus virginianus]|nr:hypothetical protein H355_004536 [Colinus virginianus]